MPRLFLTIFSVLCFVLISISVPSTAQDEAKPDIPTVSKADIATAKSIVDTLTLAKQNNDAHAYLKAARAAASLDGSFSVGDGLSEELTVEDMLEKAVALAPDDEGVKAEANDIIELSNEGEGDEGSGEKAFKVCKWKMKWGFDNRGRFRGKHTWSCLGKKLRRF